MTIKSSGTLSMIDIAAELGISATGLSLNDTRCRTLAGVSSGPISFSNFYGKTNNHVVASGWSISASSDTVKPNQSTVTVTFNSNGTITGDSATSMSGTAWWYGPSPVAGIGSNYWIQMDSGAITSISGFSFQFHRSGASIGQTSGNGTFKIFSDSAGTNLVSSGTYSYSCTVETNA